MNAFSNSFKMYFYVNFTSLKVLGYGHDPPKVKGTA